MLAAHVSALRAAAQRRPRREMCEHGLIASVRVKKLVSDVVISAWISVIWKKGSAKTQTTPQQASARILSLLSVPALVT